MIYFDNSSTTQIYPEVAEFIYQHSQKEFFNPSGIYAPSLKVAQQIEKARQKLLKMLGAVQSEVLFTASATEANNYALRCFVGKNKKILVSEGEHSSIYQTALFLKQKNIPVEFVKITERGLLDIEDLKLKLTEDVGLVSFIHINNETGAINDLKSISEIVRKKCPEALIHSDGVQALGKIDINLSFLGVDMYTVSSHKVHGPRGVGALIFNKKHPPKPLIIGGGQEKGWRSGTENASAILGFILSAEKMYNNLDENYAHIELLRKILLEGIQSLNSTVIGEIDSCVPHILSVSFEDIKGEVLVHMLEQNQAYVSTGSSCNSKHMGNRVLLSMGKSKKQESGNIRISFCEQNTTEEVYKFIKLLTSNIQKIKGLKIWKK